MALIVYVGDNPSVYVPALADVIFHEDPPEWLARSWAYDLGGVIIAGEAVDVADDIAASMLLQPVNWQPVDDAAHQLVADLAALAAAPADDPAAWVAENIGTPTDYGAAEPGDVEPADPAEDDPAPAEDGDKPKARRRN